MIKKWNTIVFCFLLAAKPSPKSILPDCLCDYVQDRSFQSWKYYTYALTGEADPQNVLTVAVQRVFWGSVGKEKMTPSIGFHTRSNCEQSNTQVISTGDVFWHISVCKLYGNALHSLCYMGPCVPRTLISPAEINFLSLLRLNFLCYRMTFSAS